MTDTTITPATFDPLACQHDGSLLTHTYKGEAMEVCACGMVAIEQEDGAWIEVC